MTTDFIQGDKFKWMATYVYAPHEKSKDDYDHLENTFHVKDLKDGDIIYTHTMYVKNLFRLLNPLSGSVTVITHNSDNAVEYIHIPSCVKKWYSTNVHMIDGKLKSIPIGLENDRWFKGEHKKEIMLRKIKEERKIRNLVYMNHNVATNPAKRLKPYQIFKDKDWVTIENGKNGVDYNNYLDNLYNHRFMICPEGNGIDTVRKWECLYMGTIPIELRNINNRHQRSFPVCYVNDWEEVTEWFLLKEVQRIKKLNFDYNKLTFNYWKNKILNYE
jgi:hypothetical protein